MATSSFSLKRLLSAIRAFVRDNFNLHEGKESEYATIARIESEVAFRGANLWILIFAILVCSVGLNVNSTAVVIGAMLISPLMGPIMGVGLGIGINDFDLIVRAVKNMVLAAVISVMASAAYFWISPLDVAQSELISRTSPNIWDVFIAISGGFAGIIASTRKSRGNAIPGVAIATALMPPLCTAGFGIATFQWTYFVGAMYLFFINSVFISLATYIIVRFLGYTKKEFIDSAREKKVKLYIFIFTLIVIVPSTYTGYNLVSKTIFQQNANQFIKSELVFDNTQIINSNLVFEKGKKQIQILLFGDMVDEELIEQRKELMSRYKLRDTELVVRQGNQKDEVNLETIEQMNQTLKSGIIEDLFEKNESIIQTKNERIEILENEIVRLRSKEIPMHEMANEAKAINDNIQELSLSSAVVTNVDSMTFDTLILAYVDFKGRFKKEDSEQIETWLKARLKVEKIKLVTE